MILEKNWLKKQKLSNNTLTPLIASTNIIDNIPKNADPKVFKSLFTSSVDDMEEGETFCCRHVGHRLC